MKTIENGLIKSANVAQKSYESLEHGDLKRHHAIVLHRTGTSTAKSVLAAYGNGQKTGAHFLVAEDGAIYQTAPMNKICWHVGLIRARCKLDSSCDPKELKTINAIMHQKRESFGERAHGLYHHELQKKYPLRYPCNDDSIGIEVVGSFNGKSGLYASPAVAQCKSMKWIVDVVARYFFLNVWNDVYYHGRIGRKLGQKEGYDLLMYLYANEPSMADVPPPVSSVLSGRAGVRP